MNGWQGRNYFSGLLWKYKNSYSDNDQTKIIWNSGHYKDRTYSVIPVQTIEEKTKRLKEVVDMAYSKTSKWIRNKGVTNSNCKNSIAKKQVKWSWW